MPSERQDARRKEGLRMNMKDISAQSGRRAGDSNADPESVLSAALGRSGGDRRHVRSGVRIASGGRGEQLMLAGG